MSSYASLVLLAGLAFAACGPRSSREGAVGPPASAPAAAGRVVEPSGGDPPVLVRPADAAAGGFALPAIPLPAAPRRGALRVEGYPSKLAVGMSDAAEAFGFTHDNAFAFCMFDACCREGQSFCELQARDGSKRSLLSPVMFADDPKRPGIERRSRLELEHFVKVEGLSRLVGNSMDNTRPPDPTGEWAYGGDIVLVVSEIAPSDKGEGESWTLSPGLVKVGGRLDGEKTVWVYFPPRPEVCARVPICFETQMNALMLSRDEREIAFLTYTRHPSHGSSQAVSRIGTGELAGMVLNSTGHVHHKSGDYGRAAELFTRAVYADPTRELFAYNLACALARSSDERAKHALAHARRLGGAKVVERARKDSDFDAVREKPWFAVALAP